ncbi:MAG: LytTR family transcriptional regulator DNA-binding domain-containing protein [Lachnospiraceae bacterium]|nr:LytTR family transcriptional regulator [Lachnospiraceae bacterium]MCI8825405.1 LytTR family transcriptional regulator [Lachnospiraceae bacterium]MCI9370366.1 LytTR family transcriptional regulator [Lachnospiraceae bacterium]
MQINIEIQDDISDTIITIKCREQDIFIERLIAALQIIDRQIMVRYNENIIALNLEEILYIESVDKKCFIYTADKVYESFNKLYELQQQLEQYLFVRINKSCIVNLNNISSIKTYIDRRLLITLSNNEQLIASRQYANGIKALLGVK